MQTFGARRDPAAAFSTTTEKHESFSCITEELNREKIAAH